MNLFKPAFKIGAFVMLMWGTAMLVPLFVTWHSWLESRAFIYSSACCFLLAGTLYHLGRGHLQHMQPRAIIMITASNWLLITLTGTLPFMFSASNPGFVNSLFESVSGVTTSGGTIYHDIEALSKGIRLWRTLSQWVGGIGIILVAVAVLPSLKIGGMRLFRSEFSEWSQLEKGRIGKIAIQIMLVYSLISIACLIAFKIFGMSWFDSFTHMLATVSTGGFSNYNDSFGNFSEGSLQIVASIFMFIGACPFLLMVISVQQRSTQFLRDRQVVLLLKIVVLATVCISAWRHFHTTGLTLSDNISSSAFNVISIITTTGFASDEYQTWGSFPLVILFFLVFTGGCSGSTAGGIKLFRFQMLYLFMKEQIYTALHPGVTYPRRYNDQPIRDDVLVGSLAYLFFVIVSWVLSSILLAATGLDLITSISGSISALSNVGPGLGDVIGPVGNYSSLSNFAKLVLICDMLLGRLEYFALVVIFTRDYWRW
jgi:trk system potassium uptake protein TrkH